MQGTEVRTYSKYELAALYKVKWPTLRLWLKPIHQDLDSLNNPRSKNIIPKDVVQIFEFLGNPSSVWHE